MSHFHVLARPIHFQHPTEPTIFAIHRGFDHQFLSKLEAVNKSNGQRQNRLAQAITDHRGSMFSGDLLVFSTNDADTGWTSFHWHQVDATKLNLFSPLFAKTNKTLTSDETQGITHALFTQQRTPLYTTIATLDANNNMLARELSTTIDSAAQQHNDPSISNDTVFWIGQAASQVGSEIDFTERLPPPKRIPQRGQNAMHDETIANHDKKRRTSAATVFARFPVSAKNWPSKLLILAQASGLPEPFMPALNTGGDLSLTTTSVHLLARSDKTFGESWQSARTMTPGPIDNAISGFIPSAPTIEGTGLTQPDDYTPLRDEWDQVLNNLLRTNHY